MLLRRFLVGFGVVAVVGAWAFFRPGGSQAHAGHPDGLAVLTATADDESSSANHDEALHRFRAGQSRHWRHVMIGGGR